MNKLEQSITSFNGTLPKFYKRYVDDVFLVFRSTSEIEPLHEYMNSLHENIQFTYEMEYNNCLPFIDVKVKRSDKYQTSQWFIPTDTGLYLTPFSQCDKKYQNSLLSTLFNRTWELSLT